MTIKWTDTSTSALENGIKILAYGESGTGKTEMIKTLPNPLIISAENGLLTLRNYGLKVAQVQTYQDVVDLYNWLLTGGDGNQFPSIAIDSISEIGEVVLESFKKSVRDGRQAYGEANAATLDLMKKFRDMPGRNVYITAMQEFIKDDSGFVRAVPMFPGKQLAPRSPYLFDFVFRTFVQVDDKTKKRTYLIQTGNDNAAVAKDRSGLLQHFAEPNLGNIITATYSTIQAQQTQPQT